MNVLVHVRQPSHQEGGIVACCRGYRQVHALSGECVIGHDADHQVIIGNTERFSRLESLVGGADPELG